MSLFYVMRPDNVEEPFPVFTRYGNLSKNLSSVVNRARKVNGRVYETSGAETRLVSDFYSEPVWKPKPVVDNVEFLRRQAFQ